MKLSISAQRRSLLFVIVICAFSFVLSAQGFNNRYVDTRPSMQYAGLLVEDSTMYTVGLSSRQDPPFSSKPMWSKLSFEGGLTSYTVIADSDSIGYGTFLNTFEKENDSVIKLFGYVSQFIITPMLCTIKKNGTFVRKMSYTDSSAIFLRGDYMTKDNLGNYYLGCNFQYPNGSVDACIIKVNREDSVLWKRKYGAGSPWWEFPTSLTLLNNGNVMIGSFKEDRNLPNMRSYTWLFEIDGNGAIVRQWFDHDSTMEARALKQTSDGGFIYASKRILEQDGGDAYCHTTVVKINNTFTKQWTWEGNIMSNSFIGATDIEELPNGDFLVCGNGNYRNPTTVLASAFVLNLQNDGSVKWLNGYTALDTSGVDNYLNDIDILPDGSYVAVGYVNIPSAIQPTQRQQAWILKIDSNGCIIENCILGSPLTPEGGTAMRIQPNPATNFVQVETENEMLGAELRVYDVTGKLMLNKTVVEGKEAMDVSGLNSGMYVIIAEKQGKFARAKLVVE